MQTPPQVAAIDAPLVIAEPGIATRTAVNLAVIALVLVVPGTTALVLRPENAGEGVVAVALAAIATAWQLRRAATTGVEVGPAGIRRRGGRLIPWDRVVDLHLHTTSAVDRAAQRVPLHQLRATTPTGAVPLTRHPLRDDAAEALVRRLMALGLDVPIPVRPAPRSPA